MPSFSVHFLAFVIKHPAYEMIKFRVSFEVSMLYYSRVKFLRSTMQLFPQIIQSLNFWVRKACEIETNAVSIERVCEYAKMDKEVSILLEMVSILLEYLIYVYRR